MQKRILLSAPILSRSGYGEQARFALRALRSRPDLFDIYISNLPWGHTGQVSISDEESTFIIKTIEKTAQYHHAGNTFDMSLQVTIPNEFQRIAPVNVGYTAGIETTKVTPQWIAKSNEIVNRVITTSTHSQEVFENTKYDVQDQHGNPVPNWGLQIPIKAVSYPIRVNEPQELEIEFTTQKNFLAVSQWGPRKNLENTIRWFVEEFHDDDDVGLILKTNSAADSIMDREFTARRLSTLLAPYTEKKCKIYFLHGEITEGNLAWLYTHPTMKALINIGHGEGFGLPLFEAACCGLPLITTTWSGQLDFICKTNKKGKRVPRVASVAYDIVRLPPQMRQGPGADQIFAEDAMWCEAKEASYKRTLRDVLAKETHYRKEAVVLRNHILETFTEENQYREFVDFVIDKESAPEMIDWMEWNDEVQAPQEI